MAAQWSLDWLWADADLEPLPGDITHWRPHAPSSAHPEPASQWRGDEAGTAEPEVGRAVYEIIEKLLDIDPRGSELAYPAHLVESVEEVGGYYGPHGAPCLSDRDAVAAFLKLRDENVGPGEADDAERLESADALIAALAFPTQDEPLGVDLVELKRLHGEATKYLASPNLKADTYGLQVWGECLKGGDSHLFDVRGWGELTGKGHGAQGLSNEDGIAAQRARQAYLVAAWNAVPTLIAEIERRGRK